MDVGQQWRRRMTGFWMMSNPMFGHRFRHLHKLHNDAFLGLNAVCLPDSNPPGAVYRSSLPATPVSTPLWENHHYFTEQSIRDRLCRTPSPRKCRLFEPRGSISDAMGLNSLGSDSDSSPAANVDSEIDGVEDDAETVSSPEQPEKIPPPSIIRTSSMSGSEGARKREDLLHRRLFVGNISYRITQKNLKEFFGQFGKVTNAYIVEDHIRKWSKGYGFVTFSSSADREKAILASEQELELDGRCLRVSPAEEKRTSRLRKEAAEVVSPTVEPDMTTMCKTMGVVQQIAPPESLNDLEDDLLLNIFTYLDTPSRVRIERVCKRWQILALRAWQSQESLSNWTCFSIFTYCLSNVILRNLLKKCAPNLRRLDLSTASHVLDFQAIEIIAHLCPNLEHVNLSGLPVTNVSLQQLAQKCPRLKTVVLQRCFDVGEKGFWWLLHLCKDLEYLDASETVRLTGQCFHMARPKLRSLMLNSCTKLCPQGFTKVATKCQHLRILHLSHCSRLTDRALELLCQSLRQLTVLHLGGRFLEVSSSGLHHIGRLSNLEGLSLIQNSSVTDDVVCAISRGCRRLRMLNLSGCHDGGVSDASLKSISECPRLRTLYISYLDRVTDEGVSAVARQGQLEVLQARGCPNLGDKGFMAVALLCPYMQSLDVSGCVHVSKFTVQACMEATGTRTPSEHTLKLLVGGTSVQDLDFKLDNAKLEISFLSTCQDHLRPDRVDYLGIPAAGSESDDEDEEEAHVPQKGWPITEDMAEDFLRCDDPALVADMWPS